MIDWKQVNVLRDEVGAEDFGEVVELFLMEVDAEMDALDAVDTSKLGAKLHFLKGSASSLGFEEFSALCQSKETLVASDPQAKLDLGALQDSYQTSRTAFLAELTERTEG